jgi:hypothetical protein
VITAAATANNAATTAATTANTAATSATTAATTAVAAATAATAAATTATAAAAGNSIADTAAAIKNSDIQIGIGLGFSASPQTTYSYTLTAPDHFLQRQPESYSFPVVSAVICYNPSYYFIKQGDEDKPAAQQNTELQAGRYAWLAAVNLNDVFTSNLDFNQRISLGLGGGRRFGTSNHFYIGIFAEGVLRRFLRDAYDGRLGNTLPAFPVNNIPSIVTTLNLNDETYFVTRPVFSVALKFIYIISGGAPKIPVSGEKNK